MLRRLIDKGIELSPAVWEVFTKQAIVNGIYQSIVSVILLIITVALWVFVKKLAKAEKAQGDYFGSVITALVLLLCLTLFLVTLHSGISNLVNPEYAAARMILQIIK